MKFDEETKELIAANAKKIQEWLETEIVPQLAENLRIEFGGTITSPRTFSRTSKYTLSIYRKGDYMIDDNGEKQSVGLCCGFGFVQNITDGYVREGVVELMENWATIKNEILVRTKAQNAKIERIKKFEI